MFRLSLTRAQLGRPARGGASCARATWLRRPGCEPTPPEAPSRAAQGRLDGQALVEFAFVLLFGMVSLIMLLDIGRFFFEYNAMRGGVLMGAVQMQEYKSYSSYSSTCSSIYEISTPESGTDNPCRKLWQIMKNASGLGDAPANDLYGAALTTAEKEKITFTAVSGTLFSSCSKYKITWQRPFLPLAPYSRQLLALGTMSLTMTAEVQGRHNNATAGTSCT